MKRSMIIGLILISFLSITSGLRGQQGFAQEKAPGFVPMPDDIICYIEGISYRPKVGEGGEGYVKGVTC